jgi:thymidylate synthase
MLSMILATDKNGGIGKNGVLPWKNPTEMKIFKEKTLNKTILIGRKTYDSIKNGLKNRDVLIASKKTKSIDFIVSDCKEREVDLMVCGGGEIYEYVLKNYKVDKIHLSVLNDSFDCDVYTKINLTDWMVIDTLVFDDFKHYTLIPSNGFEKQYLELAKNILENGSIKHTRNSETKSLFSQNFTFNLERGDFPLLTTKRMFFRGVVEELLFFLRGETDTKLLEEQGVNIWRGNTNRGFLDANGFPERKEGLMGPMYGYQFRSFGSEYNEETGKSVGGFDQLKYVIDTIKTEPDSRRILMSSFSASQAREGVLYPCHSLTIQFYTRVIGDKKYLDMFCYNRSQDVFHGVPFNIASSALLLLLVANETGYSAGILTVGMGDCHIYKDHFESIQTQLTRIPFSSPNVSINKNVSIYDMSVKDITLHDYKCHPSIKADMIA